MLLEIILVFAAVCAYFVFRRHKNVTFANEHFLITGGSSGIGLAVAIGAAEKGANVSLIARSIERLDSAKEKISQCLKNNEQKILTYSVDVYKDHEKLAGIVQNAEENSGPITYLINCAGTSVCYRMEETLLEDFSRMMNVNYLGSVYVTRALIPLMKQRKKGTIVFVSSMAGLTGLYGYTAYSASKFALMGLAEALQMEVKPFGIKVMVSFPPDTDTPGYAEEIKTKPIETIRICESGGLYTAEQVATKMLTDAKKGKFMSAIGFEGWLVCTLCSGMTPVTSLLELFAQVLLMGVFRITGAFYLFQSNRTIRQCAEEKAKEK